MNIYWDISIIYTIYIRHAKVQNKGITFVHDRVTEIENQITILSSIKFHKKNRNCKSGYKDLHYV